MIDQISLTCDLTRFHNFTSIYLQFSEDRAISLVIVRSINLLESNMDEDHITWMELLLHVVMWWAAGGMSLSHVTMEHGDVIDIDDLLGESSPEVSSDTYIHTWVQLIILPGTWYFYLGNKNSFCFLQKTWYFVLKKAYSYLFRKC